MSLGALRLEVLPTVLGVGLVFGAVVLSSCESTEPEILTDARTNIVETAEGCEELDGTSQAGGREYAWGEYERLFDGSWLGSEAVYFYANSASTQEGVQDCFILWDVSAVYGSVGNCRDCDLALAVNATVDEYGSSCPETMWQSRSSFSTGYAVEQAADSTASWQFSESGNHFADGYWIPEASNFLTEPECVWL